MSGNTVTSGHVQQSSDLTIKIIERDTPVPFKEVIARLDIEVNKAGSENVAQQIRDATTREELERVVNGTVGNSGFLHFTEYQQGRLLKLFNEPGKHTPPSVVAYTIGNPLIAQVILRYNPRAAYSIPPRLLVIEKPNGAGTIIQYQLPSSVMSLPEGKNPAELQNQLLSLDDKFQRLVAIITAPVPQRVNSKI